MTNFEKLIEGLTGKKIEFVLIGGIAAITHGSAYETRDLDICYERSAENIKKLAGLLKALNSKLRGAPEDIRFLLDEKTIAMGLNFTFNTSLGAFDMLGEVAGLGDYPKVKAYSEPLELYGCKVNVLTVEGLIRAKKAAGRPKDLLVLKELEALKELKKRNDEF